MDIRFLSSLLAVVETGSIAAAARQQNLSPAAVSQRIRVLEEELGCVLLNRSAHSASPTAECHRLLPLARELSDKAASLRSMIDPSGLSGPFRLGAISTALFDHVPAILRCLEAEAPRAELSVRPGSSSELHGLLDEGQLDAALVVAPPFDVTKTIRVHPIERQAFVRVLPPGVSLADEEAVARLPWIVYERTSWGGSLTTKLLHAVQQGGRILCELDSPETIALMVEQGIGQSILPVWNALSTQHPKLNLVPLNEEEPLQREIVYMERAAGGLSPLAALIRGAIIGKNDSPRFAGSAT